MATADSPEQANRRCADFIRAQDQMDPQVATGILPAGSYAIPGTAPGE
ncbi:hypothetical protein [Streptomyces sp. AP-93]|nr:hypothetical protein [Streptomyces sp. AP-93]MCJ0875585.1 hypothetical protein [Streptomyces sp. AP-93]